MVKFICLEKKTQIMIDVFGAYPIDLSIASQALSPNTVKTISSTVI